MNWKQRILEGLEQRDIVECPPEHFIAFRELYARLATTPESLHLQRMYNTQSEQLQQTRDTVSRLNDELVASEIENNLLQKRVDELVAENEELVGRWLAKMQLEVDAVNRGNA